MNNKGFAITTILYGTFLLFMMLLLVMLSILSRYKDNIAILMDNVNGARDIVDVYDKDSHFMTIEGTKYYKLKDGIAIMALVYDNESKCTGPVLISKNKDAVAYYTSSGENYESTLYVNYGGDKYYYSTGDINAWECGNNYSDTHIYKWTKKENMTLEAAVIEILNEKVPIS